MSDLNLEDHNIEELAHATTIQNGIIYVDGVRVSSLSNTLHVVDDVFAVDFYNAIIERDPTAIRAVDGVAQINPFE